MAGVQPERLFAILIGIDDYLSPPKGLDRLRGAVKDVMAMKEYLVDDLSVPRSRIKTLCDYQATRAAIIEALRGLIYAEEVVYGDPVLVYFAGHGASAAAPAAWGWKGRLENDWISFILPYDFSEHSAKPVHGIPDRTLGALFQRAADVKGDNIVRLVMLFAYYYVI